MKQKKKQPVLQEAKVERIPYPSKQYMIYIGALFGFIVLARFIASLFPDERLWGLNYTSFLSFAAQVIALGVGVIFCTPAIYPSFRFVARIVFGDDKNEGTRAPLIFIVAAAGLLFWTFSMETYFLGDGASYLAEQFRFIMGMPVTDVLYGSKSAPLTGMLLAYSAKFLSTVPYLRVHEIPAHLFAFRIFGTLCGMIFVAGAWQAARNFFDAGWERLSVFLLFVSAPGALFYFGYVEYYTFFFTCMFYYFFYMMRSAEGKVHVAVPTLILIVACGFHFMGLLAVPSLVFLYLFRSKNERIRSFASLRNAVWMFLIALVAGGLYYFISGIYEHGSRNIMSLFPVTTDRKIHNYTLLSSYHLVDFLNYLFLLAAPLLIGIVLFGKREFIRVPSILLMCINMVFFACLTFFGNTSFGLARDWDVNAAFGLVVAFLLIGLARQYGSSPLRSYVLYLVCGSLLSVGIAWFAVNVSAEPSVNRFKALLALDDRHVAGDYALNGYEHLRKYYYTTKNTDGLLWAIRKKIECVGYPFDYHAFLGAVAEEIPVDKQRPYYDWMLQSLRSRIDSLNKQSSDTITIKQKHQFIELAAELCIIFANSKAENGFGTQYAESTVADFLVLAPGSILLEFVKRETEYAAYKVEQNREFLLRVGDDIQGSTQLCVNLGGALMRLREFERAATMFKKGYSIDTTYAMPLVLFAYSELQSAKPNAAEAEAALEKYLRNPRKPGSAKSNASNKAVIDNANKLLDHIRRTYGKQN